VTDVRQSADTPAPEADLTRTYVLVLVVELAVLIGLYSIGRYFS
jgi:hypothetical protein